MEFTYEEFELLQEAVKSLEGLAASRDFASSLIAAMMAKTKEETKAAFDKAKNVPKDEEVRRRELSDKLTVLRAKIIQAKTAMIETT